MTSTETPLPEKKGGEVSPSATDHQYDDPISFIFSKQTMKTVALTTELTGQQMKQFKRCCWRVCGPCGIVGGIAGRIGFALAANEITSTAIQTIGPSVAFGVGFALAYALASWKIAWPKYVNDRIALHPHTLALETYLEPENASSPSVWDDKPVPENIREVFRAFEAYNNKVSKTLTP